MRPLLPCLGLLLALSIPATAGAQNVADAYGTEHRYQFDVPATLTAYNEKLLTEAINGFDPEMKVDIDRPTRVMKVLAYRALDPIAVVHVAAQLGLTITQRRVYDTLKQENE